MAPAADPQVWVPAEADVTMLAVSDAGWPSADGVTSNVHCELPEAVVCVGEPFTKICPVEVHWTAGDGETAGIGL